MLNSSGKSRVKVSTATWALPSHALQWGLWCHYHRTLGSPNHCSVTHATREDRAGPRTGRAARSTQQRETPRHHPRIRECRSQEHLGGADPAARAAEGEAAAGRKGVLLLTGEVSCGKSWGKEIFFPLPSWPKGSSPPAPHAGGEHLPEAGSRAGREKPPRGSKGRASPFSPLQAAPLQIRMGG